MKVVVTARDFSSVDPCASEMMINAGYEVVEIADALLLSLEEMVETLKDADAIIVGTEKIQKDLLEQLPNLKLIARRGIGLDAIDVKYCEERKIAISRTVGLVEGSVAEYVMAGILYFARRMDLQTASMKRGEWNRLLTGGAKTGTLGLVGFGGIGKEIAKRALPFEMDVLYYRRHRDENDEKGWKVTYTDMDTLLAESDYVSVNVPLTDETRNLFDYQMIKKMKPNAILINISRGAVVNADDLARALKEGVIAGAVIDVYNQEPCTDSPLIDCENALLTPHTAPFTTENFILMNNKSAQTVIEFLNQ